MKQKRLISGEVLYTCSYIRFKIFSFFSCDYECGIIINTPLLHELAVEMTSHFLTVIIFLLQERPSPSGLVTLLAKWTKWLYWPVWPLMGYPPLVEYHWSKEGSSFSDEVYPVMYATLPGTYFCTITGQQSSISCKKYCFQVQHIILYL